MPKPSKMSSDLFTFQLIILLLLLLLLLLIVILIHYPLSLSLSLSVILYPYPYPLSLSFILILAQNIHRDRNSGKALRNEAGWRSLIGVSWDGGGNVGQLLGSCRDGDGKESSLVAGAAISPLPDRDAAWR